MEFKILYRAPFLCSDIVYTTFGLGFTATHNKLVPDEVAENVPRFSGGVHAHLGWEFFINEKTSLVLDCFARIMGKRSIMSQAGFTFALARKL